MDFIILAAGTSSRMPQANKLLLPVRGTSLCSLAIREAMKAREELGPGKLVVVTGFEAELVTKEIHRSFPDVPVEIVINHDFLLGQFSSTLTGLKAIDGTKPFFITLCDLPLIKSSHYIELSKLIGTFDAVRPFTRSTPGHPVLHAAGLHRKLLGLPVTSSVRQLLGTCNVYEHHTDDTAWTTDIDTYDSYQKLVSHQD